MLMPCHDPRDAFYRAPFGAVPSGTAVRLRIRTPRDFEVSSAVLCARLEARAQELQLTMTRCRELDDPDYDTFTATLDLTGYLGLVFYAFRLRRKGGDPYYYAKYPAAPEYPDVTGGIYNNAYCPRWQITVYDADYKTPDWYGRGVTYQIFPDRFRASKAPCADGCRSPRRFQSWDEVPEHIHNEDHVLPNDNFYGGDLAGIREKLPYLHELGVTTLYLNPIFESSSNHRYNTGDYEHIDPLLGTDEDFSTLCREAHALGMRVILDGVFNHTGSDSRYFNAFGHYDSVGAAQSKNSPYYSWYLFDQWPHTYDCWWGVKTLPDVNESCPSYLDYILRSKDAIVRRWLRAGADGWRLDVADELPGSFLKLLRRVVHEENPDAVIIGEVWEDASNKESYGQRRDYLLGHELDGVMNYPLRDAILSYLHGGDAFYFRDTMNELIDHYPRPAQYSMMNILGTHDTPRILTLLGCPDLPDDYEERANHALTPDQRARGLRLTKLAAAILYCYPGSPTVYYADEAGLEGCEDPFNRRGYPWGREEMALVRWFRFLGRLRANHPALQAGDLRIVEAKGALLILERRLDDECIVLCVNAGCDDLPLTLPGTLIPLDGGSADALLRGESCRIFRVE